MDDIPIKLKIFESALWEAYNQVKNEDKTYWVSLHKVMVKVGMSLELFNQRLEQLWKNQFASSPQYVNRYQFGLEVDASPTNYYRLRNKQIIIDGCPMFIIQMNLKSEVQNG